MCTFCLGRLIGAEAKASTAGRLVKETLNICLTPTNTKVALCTLCDNRPLSYDSSWFLHPSFLSNNYLSYGLTVNHERKTT